MANFIKNMEDFGITKEYLIAANAWSADKTYTISDPLISATNSSSQFISYNPNNYTDTMYLELCAAVIRVVSILDGQITLKCMGDVPTLQLPITITYKTNIITSNFAMDAVPTSGSQNPISSDGVYEAIKTVTVSESDGSGDLTVDRTEWKSVSCTLTIAKGLALLSFNAQAAKSFSSGAHTLCTLSQKLINQLEPGYYVFIVYDNSGGRKGDVTINENGAVIQYYQSNTSADHWVGGFAVIPTKS